ncbi:uncharacterized protein [Panulirus ornatus]|uniref:uncharacterized protein isoform X2 n=1 Tax=Panulirus ornatus TaxID=150431 RepID=UPI003A85C3E4
MMVWVTWPRLPRMAVSGVRPVLAAALLLTLTIFFTLHARLCVGGMWGCGGGREEAPGPDAIIQLRRDVANKLLRLARDLRSGQTVSVVVELEATAALLDARYNQRVRGPPPPKLGFAPSPLSSLSTPSVPSHNSAGSHDLHNGRKAEQTIDSGHTETSDKMKNDNNGRLTPDDSKRRISQQDSVGADAQKMKPVEGQQTPSDRYQFTSSGKEMPQRDSVLDYSESVKSIYPAYPSDVVNILPGLSDLEDLGDDPLPPLLSQVTVILDGCSSSPPHIVSVVRQARVMWPGVAVIVGLDEEKRGEVDDISHLSGVMLVTVQCEKWRRGDLRILATSVTTPFVLILDGVMAITDDLDLLRLLSVGIGLQSLGVGVIGGAERGRDGSWDYMCTRVTLRNSRLTLRDGYEFSRAACLFCDVTSSSFLAATKVILDVPFDLSLPHRSQAIDWSLRLQRQGYLTMTCPDVMFNVLKSLKPKEQHREIDRSCVTKEDRKQARAQLWAVKRQYRKLAQKWELNFVTFNNGTSFEYNCREIHYDCSAYYKVRYYILPPCCLKIKNKMFNTVDIIAKENRVPYEISSGTLLGALKFKDGLPWDFDDDAYYRNSDVEIFIRNKYRMKRLGLSPYFSDQVSKANRSVTSKYIYATSQGGFALDLWGKKTMPSVGTLEALEKYPDNLVCFQHGHVPTPIRLAKQVQKNKMLNKTMKVLSPSCYLSSLIRVGSNWLPGPWNPGKKALGHYGDNLFRHEAHWRWNSIEDPGWRPCPRPGHHACLDTHPLDGSLPFL